MVDKKEVSKVQIEDDMIYFQDKEETPNYYETAAFEDPDLVERLYDAGCSFDRVVQKEMSPLLSFLLTWILPILIFARTRGAARPFHDEADGRRLRRDAVWKE